MTADQIEKEIRALFKKYMAVKGTSAKAVAPGNLTAGKLYEAFALAHLAKELVGREGLQLTLVGSTFLRLKSAPGPINPAYPHVEVRRADSLVGRLWTDVEFTSLSRCLRGIAGAGGRAGDCHELDLVIAEPDATGRPTPDQVLLGAECKDTNYEKNLLREILGVRRELSLLRDLQTTIFSTWPRRTVPAFPPSCLLVYATDAAVSNYAAPGDVFGIDFIHLDYS